MIILKMLSYHKNWSQNDGLLVNMYKVLLDQSSCCKPRLLVAKKVANDFEIIQNNALRITFKTSIMDHVEVGTLREWEDLTSFKDRHENLLCDYYE